MTSKECLEKLSYIPIYEEDIDIIFKGDLCEVYRNEVDIISKDLDLFEEYRKIEEELGVDLITLFTALERGVWYKDYKDNDKIKFTDYIEENMKCKELIVPAKYTIIGLKFRDYGKTWALDKEEFYKNIK